jgi:hypothetical protein
LISEAENFIPSFRTVADQTQPDRFASVQNNTGVLEGTDWSAPKNPFPFWIGAVSEAVFMIGAERNAAVDRVWGASYAPTLQNLNSYEWTVSEPSPASNYLNPGHN